MVLNGESALGDLGLSRHEKLNIVISFIKRPNEPNCVVAPYSRPRRQAAEDAKAIIPIALKNDEKLRHAERKAYKKNNNKKNKCSRDDGSSFSGMGVRLKDENKIGRPSIPKGKAYKIRGVFGGVGRVLANSNPVLHKEKLVMGCKLNKSDIAEILLSGINAKITRNSRVFMHNGNISLKRRGRKVRLCLDSWLSVLGIMLSQY